MTEPFDMEFYFAALDEIYVLRRALAYEAAVVRAQTSDVPRLGKGRTEQLQHCVDRMRAAARGAAAVTYAGTSSRSLESSMVAAEANPRLTRNMWETSVVRRLGWRPAEAKP